MVLRALISPIAVVILCIPLMIATHRRLCDLNLSGVFLFAFPIWPLVPFILGPFLYVALFPLGGGQLSLFLNPDFWLGAACLFLLALMPGRLAGGPPKQSAFLALQRTIETRSRLNAAQFRRKSLRLIGLALVISVLPILIGRVSGLSITTILFVPAKMTVSLIVLILTVYAIRRLNDLGRSYLWSAFLPLFLPRMFGMVAFVPIIFSGRGLSTFTRSLSAGPEMLRYVFIAGMAGCLIVLAWLMSRKTSDWPTVTEQNDIEDDKPLSKNAFFSPGKIALASLATVIVVSAIYKTQHPYDYYRYRMSVTVETPEGLRTGSAVRQGNFEKGSSNRASWAVGEAVVVDLGERGVAYALIDNSNIGDGVSYTTTCNHSDFGLKKTPVGKKWVLSPSEYPRLVTFRDPQNPKTIETLFTVKGNGRCGAGGKWEVQADRFEEIFGEGVRLKEISLEITKDPLTEEIEKRIPWLYCPAKETPAQRFSNQGKIIDTGTLKRQPREYYLKKRKARTPEVEKPECRKFQEQWASYDRRKFQDELSYWRRLADQGGAEAQFEVGRLLAKGDGHEVAADRTEAVKWYKLAANQGYTDAQAQLAHAYRNKEGVQQNWQEAYFWASLASLGTDGRGLVNAGDLLNAAHKNITPEERAAVEKRVREWKPAPQMQEAPQTVPDITALSEKLLGFAYGGKTELAKLVVERGADINVRNSGGLTALMQASRQGDAELVSYLIDKGADINAIDNYGGTALSMAANNGHTEVVKRLLDKGAVDASIKGQTAQQAAERKGHTEIAGLIRDKNPPAPQPRPRRPLFANLPSNTEIYYLGVYESDKKNRAPRPAGLAGNRYGDVQVSISRKNAPILLVLTSYEPVRWVVNQYDSVNVVGVILSGYYKQSVEGIAETTPIYSISYAQSETPDIPYFYNYDEKSPKLLGHIKLLEDNTGISRERIKFSGAYSRSNFEIE